MSWVAPCGCEAATGCSSSIGGSRKGIFFSSGAFKEFSQWRGRPRERVKSCLTFEGWKITGWKGGIGKTRILLLSKSQKYVRLTKRRTEEGEEEEEDLKSKLE